MAEAPQDNLRSSENCSEPSGSLLVDVHVRWCCRRRWVCCSVRGRVPSHSPCVLFSGATFSTSWPSCITRVISVSCCRRLSSWSAVTPFSLEQTGKKLNTPVSGAPPDGNGSGRSLTAVNERPHPPVRTVVCVRNNVLHHQLCFPQFLLQLCQLIVSWGVKKKRKVNTNLSSKQNPPLQRIHINMMEVAAKSC